MSNLRQPYAAERRLFQPALIIISTYEKFTREYHFSPAITLPVDPYDAHALRLKKSFETILQPQMQTFFWLIRLISHSFN
ncbi:hypothetical protein CHI14_06055 [Paenibacillus sp. 7516]|nr:hypothetical protein CHI14_06055 [Paenibacillus sp. 7516]